MNKLRVIDLLNKIANGEEVPERIKYDTKEMKYDHNKQDYLGYYSNGNGEWLFQYLFDKCRNTKHFINDEVEIIENTKIKKLERMNSRDYLENRDKYLSAKGIALDIETLRNWINKIIDYINKEK